MNLFSINFPDQELTPRGCYLNDVVSLTAQRYILNPFTQPEAVFKDGYEGYKKWAIKGAFDPDTGNPVDRITYLKKVLDKGGEVLNFYGYIKMNRQDFEQQVVPTTIRHGGITWQKWSNQKALPAGGIRQRYQNLLVAEVEDIVYLRASHYAYCESKELHTLLSLSYLEVVDSY